MPTIEIVALQRYTHINEEVRNTYHIDGPLVGPDEVDDAIGVLRSAYAQLANYLHPTWQLYEFQWRNLSIAEMPSIPVAVTAVSGLYGGGGLSGLVIAGLVSFRSYTTPPNRSRKYIAGIPEGESTEGVPSGTMRTALIAFGQALIDKTGASIVDPAVWSFGVARVDPVTKVATAFNPYSSVTSPLRFGTMRSRDGR